MSAFSRVPLPFLQPVNGSGVPYANSKLYFYVADSSTPLDTYSNAALSVPNSNPVTADANGMFPVIYLGSGTYDIVLKSAAGATIWTAEDVAAASVSAATTTVAGIVELATSAEALAGTSSTVAMTPAVTANAIQQGFGYGSVGGTANDITITPSVTPVALSAGMKCMFRAGSANTSAMTINYGLTGVVSAKVAGTAGASACVGGEVQAGNLYEATYSSADSCWLIGGAGQTWSSIIGLTADTSPDWGSDYLMSYDGSAKQAKKVPGYAVGPALPGVTNLLIVNGNATTNVNVTYDQAVLVNAAGQGIAYINGSFTCDCSVNGAINRLDSGALANNTEYHIWLMSKPDGTGVGVIMSLSATAPTPPTGYSGGFKCRIGCFITGGAATFLRIRQIGNRAQYVVAAGTTVTAPVGFTVSTQATKTALTAAGATGAGNAAKVPSTAASIFLACTTAGTSNATMYAFPNNDAGYTTTIGAQYAARATGTANDAGSANVEMLLESANIYYISGNNAAGANAALLCLGWRDRVNAT